MRSVAVRELTDLFRPQADIRHPRFTATNQTVERISAPSGLKGCMASNASMDKVRRKLSRAIAGVILLQVRGSLSSCHCGGS